MSERSLHGCVQCQTFWLWQSVSHSEEFSFIKKQKTKNKNIDWDTAHNWADSGGHWVQTPLPPFPLLLIRGFVYWSPFCMLICIVFIYFFRLRVEEVCSSIDLPPGGRSMVAVRSGCMAKRAKEEKSHECVQYQTFETWQSVSHSEKMFHLF